MWYTQCTCTHTMTSHTHIQTIQYIYLQLYKTNSYSLVSIKMRNIRYGLVLIILLVLVELCAGQLCTTNYCCQYCNYY